MIIYCLVLPLAVAALQLRTLVRPELISYSFSILAIILYHKANNKISTANMLSILALMLVWNNYHTPIFGYVIFFGLFVDLGLAQIRQRASRSTWTKWLLWGMAVFAIGFLKPGFHHSAIGVFFFSEEWKILISEYRSAAVYLKYPATYALIIVYVTTLFALLRNRQFGLLFICILLGYYSVTMSRLVAQSSLVVLCIFAWSLSEINLRDHLQRMPLTLSRVTTLGVFLLFMLSLASPVLKARLYMEANRTPTLFPEDIVNYMMDKGIQGRIFNDHGMGGYLAFYLAPDSKVYIDGRAGILYPLDHLRRYVTATQSSSLLRDEIDKYDIELVVLKNHQRYFALARNTGKFELDYVVCPVFSFHKRESQFPRLRHIIGQPCVLERGYDS